MRSIVLALVCLGCTSNPCQPYDECVRWEYETSLLFESDGTIVPMATLTCACWRHVVPVCTRDGGK